MNRQLLRVTWVAMAMLVVLSVLALGVGALVA